MAFAADLSDAEKFQATVLSAGSIVLAVLAGYHGRQIGKRPRCPECSGLVRLTEIWPEDATARTIDKASDGAAEIGAAVGGAFGGLGKAVGAVVPKFVGFMANALRSTTAWKCEKCGAMREHKADLGPPRNGMGCGLFFVLAPAGIVGLLLFAGSL